MNSPAYGTWNGQKVVLGTGETLLGPVPAGDGSVPAYKRQHREVVGSREGVGGGRSSAEGKDNTTFPERRAPASSMHMAIGRSSDECPIG